MEQTVSYLAKENLRLSLVQEMDVKQKQNQKIFRTRQIHTIAQLQKTQLVNLTTETLCIFLLILKVKNQNTFNIKTIYPNEIKKELDALSPNKAEDVYFMNIKLIKMLSSDLAPILSHIFNSSFEKGVFPSLLKLAKVTPLFKGGDRMEPGNFRPVSVLPIFDKILEEVMKKQLMKYLDDHKILNDIQFGFRKNKSTSMAVLQILQKIYSALEEGKYHVVYFLTLLRHSIQLITRYCFLNYLIIVQKENQQNGFLHTYQKDTRSQKLVQKYQIKNQWNMGSLKALSWDQSYFQYSLMTFVNVLLWEIQRYLLMIHLYFIQMLASNNLKLISTLILLRYLIGLLLTS